MIALALMAATFALTGRATIALPGRVVRLDDVVAGAPPVVAKVVIARLPAGRSTLSRRAVAALVRRAIPGLAVSGDAGTITFDAGQEAPPRAPVSRVVAPTKPSIAKGDAMTLEFRTGPVTVSRAVTTLQPGYARRRVFVRDNAGHVFAAAVGEGAR